MQKSFLFVATVSLLAGSVFLTGCKSEDGNHSASEKPAVAMSPVPEAPSAPRPIVRIKAGSASPVTDSQANVWQPDQGFVGGDTIERDGSLQIANTTDAVLYRTEHYGMDSFSYKIPNGHYLVKLHFAETFDDVNSAGQRVFSFNVQGHEFKDFDVWKTAGGSNRAYVESVPVEITDGKLQVNFTTQVENPEINAIEIIPQS